MKIHLPKFAAGLAAIFLTSASSGAAILLVDPSSSTGTNTFASGPSQPYPVATSATWSSGSNSTFGAGGVIRYSDSSVATGVTITTDSLGAIAGPSGEYNFTTAPAVSSIGNAGIGGVFSSNPTNNSIWGNTVAGLNYGGVAMKITGLASGTYDIYLVAAYTGSTGATLPGGASAAQQNVWAFSQPGGTTTLTTGTFGAVNDVLENSTNAAWTLGNTYAKISVTISEANPDLFIISEGLAGTTENRGWLTSVQIVPEPTAALLAACGMIGFISRRRRVG